MEKYFCDSDIERVTQMYIIFPELCISHVPRKHLLFSDLQVLSEHFISIRSRSQRSPAIREQPIIQDSCPPSESWFSLVLFFHSVAVSDSNNLTKHLLAKVNSIRIIFGHFIFTLLFV